MKFNGWLEHVWSTNDNERVLRDRERVVELGVALKKSFGKLFYVKFEYAVSDIKSKYSLRDNKSHRFINELIFNF